MGPERIRSWKLRRLTLRHLQRDINLKCRPKFYVINPREPFIPCAQKQSYPQMMDSSKIDIWNWNSLTAFFLLSQISLSQPKLPNLILKLDKKYSESCCNFKFHRGCLLDNVYVKYHFLDLQKKRKLTNLKSSM